STVHENPISRSTDRGHCQQRALPMVDVEDLKAAIVQRRVCHGFLKDAWTVDSLVFTSDRRRSAGRSASRPVTPSGAPRHPWQFSSTCPDRCPSAARPEGGCAKSRGT